MLVLKKLSIFLIQQTPEIHQIFRAINKAHKLICTDWALRNSEQHSFKHAVWKACLVLYKSHFDIQNQCFPTATPLLLFKHLSSVTALAWGCIQHAQMFGCASRLQRHTSQHHKRTRTELEQVRFEHFSNTCRALVLTSTSQVLLTFEICASLGDWPLKSPLVIPDSFLNDPGR